MGCLLVNKDAKNYPRYAHYFDEKRWDDLIEQFRHETFNAYSLTGISQFEISLKAGLCCLKTAQCFTANT
jgi:hypothetical protein